jgi:formimidoylglutamate deiminase
MRKALTFEWVLEPTGLRRDRTLHLDADGRIERIDDAGAGARDGFLALPGIANAHSHAFQRALRGLGEGGGLDSFWTWRGAMYRVAARMTPDDLHIVASTAFAEMLATGYTAVGEFHYLHHLADGSRSTAMTDALIAAARDSGIRLRVLPVYYRYGGFGAAPAESGQMRFVHDDPDDFADAVELYAEHVAGFAPHSLRAVDIEDLPRLIARADGLLGKASPLHLHICEQPAEVRECVAANGRPPILLLDAKVGLEPRWNLVHATHAGLIERRRVIESGATVILCPLTEGQLGDGFFPARDFHDAGGRIGIGSDSNVRIDLVEEMRFLAFSQRALERARDIFAGAAGPGLTLWQTLARNGARATGLQAGEIAAGRYADVVVVGNDGRYASDAVASICDALLVGGGGRSEALDVYVGGVLRARAGSALANLDRAGLHRTLARLRGD